MILREIHQQSIKPVALAAVWHPGNDREFARTHGVQMVQFSPSSADALFPSTLKQRANPRSNILDAEYAVNRQWLRVFDALTQHLCAVRKQHIIRVLALACPRDPLALLTAQSSRKFVLETLARLVVVNRDNPGFNLLEQFSIRLEKRELACVVLRIRRRRTVRHRHARDKTRHLDRQLVDLAFHDNACLADVVQPVHDSLSSRLHAEVLVAITVLHVHELIAPVIRERHGFDASLDLRHVHRRRANAIAIDYSARYPARFEISHDRIG